MAKRYNPPPNWPPAPKGWAPPPGWKPDPAWGPPPPGWQVWQEDPAKPPGKKKPWGWIAGVVAAFILGLAIGGASGSNSNDDSTKNQASPVSEPGATVTESITTTTEVSGPATTKTVTAPPPPPVDKIEEGTWEVGPDIKPGRYKVIEAIQETCYWKINPIGKPDAITDNGVPTGGRPTVVLKKGQEFTNQGCGTWGRV